MIIPDLTEFSSAHPPTPHGFALPIVWEGELGSALLPADTVLRAAGWLGNQVPSSGDTREEYIDRLMLAYERKQFFPDGTMGWHNCEICTTEDQHYPGGKVGPVVHWRGRDLRLYGHAHYLIRNQNVVYMAPALVLHYLLDHQYRPLDEFSQAVIVGSFLTPEDLLFVRDEGGEP
jgi:hypothetical protein